MKQINTKVDGIWEDLIISMLSVYQHPLDRTYKFIDKLRQEGIFNLENLAKWDSVEIGNKLKNAGYDRGGITWIVSDRLSAFGKAVSNKTKEFENILAGNNKEKIQELLMPIKGVGNKVLENFYILREIK